MAISARQFNTDLYQEHLEEISFLYEQRLSYLHDPELSWIDLLAYEERYEAHIDALVIGGDLALEVCKERCSAGDFGELHAGLLVFCRQDRSDLAYAVLQDIDYADPEVTQAVIDALKAECPNSWHDDLVRIMLGRCHELIPIIVELLAYRRVPIEEALLRVFPSCAAEQAPRAIWALGRIGTPKASGLLNDCLKSERSDDAEAACRALIRLGDYHAIRHALLVAQLKPWPVLSLGIGGNHTAVNVLTEIAKGPNLSDEVLLALGLLGDLTSVGTIFNCLSNSDRAIAAATALQTITGAMLYEEVFIPEKIDPDELFDEEREKYEQTGEVPTRPDGQPFGENVTQISINPETWRAWLTAHKSQFDPKLRYRHGKPCSPAALVESLAAEQTPNRVRELICDELVCRYQAPVALEIDMPVREQDRHLAALRAWAAEHGRKFKPGLWYFAGKEMP